MSPLGLSASALGSLMLVWLADRGTDAEMMAVNHVRTFVVLVFGVTFLVRSYHNLGAPILPHVLNTTMREASFSTSAPLVWEGRGRSKEVVC